MKILLSALCALALVGCAHAGPPVDLSPPAAPPPRVHHLPHPAAPPHPVARPVVPHPRPRPHVVPQVQPAPQAAPLQPQAPFDDRWLPATQNVVTGPAQAAPAANEAEVNHRRLWVALDFLGAIGAMLIAAIWLGRRNTAPQG